MFAAKLTKELGIKKKKCAQGLAKLSSFNPSKIILHT